MDLFEHTPCGVTKPTERLPQRRQPWSPEPVVEPRAVHGKLLNHAVQGYVLAAEEAPLQRVDFERKMYLRRLELVVVVDRQLGAKVDWTNNQMLILDLPAIYMSGSDRIYYSAD